MNKPILIIIQLAQPNQVYKPYKAENFSDEKESQKVKYWTVLLHSLRLQDV